MIDYKLIRKISSKCGIQEFAVEKDYLIELFLYYLSQDTSIKRELIFRGGTALKKIYFADFRYSEDLDFIVRPADSLAAFIDKIENMLEKMRRDLPVKLIQVSRFPQKGHLQIFLSYDIVPEISSVKELKIDIVEDDIVLDSRRRKILFSFPEFENASRFLNVYDLESIVTEKIGRILDVVDEPRDLWDLWYILKSGLAVQVVNKLFYQKYGSPIHLNNLLTAMKKSGYKNSWHTRLVYQVPNLIGYEQIIGELESLLTNNLGYDKGVHP